MEFYCSVCKEEIDEKENKWSLEHNGKPLCRKHQKSIDNGLTKKKSDILKV